MNPEFWICESVSSSTDSFHGFVLSYCVLTIHFVDLIRRPVFKRFVLWIQFVRPKISKYMICFDSEGFVYESRKLSSDAMVSHHMGITFLENQISQALLKTSAEE
jgi:hypothetical protein